MFRLSLTGCQQTSGRFFRRQLVFLVIFRLQLVFLDDNRDNSDNGKNGRNARMSRGGIQPGQQDYCCNRKVVVVSIVCVVIKKPQAAFVDSVVSVVSVVV